MPFACLPRRALAKLADECNALGEGGVHALREAGRVAGGAVFETLGPGAERLTPPAFWARVEEMLRSLELGTLRFEPLDPGLGTIAWYGFPESGTPDGSGRDTRGCHLATGLLGELLGRAAGRSVAVLEIGCGASTPHACWFLIGAKERLDAVHVRLTSGASVAQALEVG